MSWREEWSPVIAAVLEKCGDKPLKEKRAALRAAWPGGPREYHPYKIWCDECRIQLGLKKRKSAKLLPKSVAHPPKLCPGQRELF